MIAVADFDVSLSNILGFQQLAALAALHGFSRRHFLRRRAAFSHGFTPSSRTIFMMLRG